MGSGELFVASAGSTGALWTTEGMSSNIHGQTPWALHSSLLGTLT